MRRQKRAFSLLEVMFAIMIIAIIMVPSITAIQSSRMRMRSVSQHLVAENLAVSVMEMVKRAGFFDYAYGNSFNYVNNQDSLPSPLLDFPRSDEPGEDGAMQNTLPAGAPGGVTDDEFAQFLSDYRSGAVSMKELAEDTAIADDTNYYFYSPNQVAAINGYDSWDDIPAEDDDSTPNINEDKTQTLLDPQYAWGFYVQSNDGPDGTANTTDDLRHVAVVVKWIDTRTGDRRFVALESWIVYVAHRLAIP